MAREGSKLRSAILDRFVGQPVIFDVFKWTGRNSQAEEMAALERELARVRKERGILLLEASAFFTKAQK